MNRSVDRILTTHTGSLPRPADLVELMFAKQEGQDVDEQRLGERISRAVSEVVERQAEIGIDVVSDGEASKPSYASYVAERLTGFGGRSDLPKLQDLLDFPEVAKACFGDPGNVHVNENRPACNGPVELADGTAVAADIANFKQALDGAAVEDAFITAASPGLISCFLGNTYYKTDVPDPVELAVLSVGQDVILRTVEDCGRRGIRNVIVTTAGFAELGPEGAALEERLVEAARRFGMRVLGPNANANSFDAMAPPINPRIGKIALVTQSSHMGRVIFQSSAHGVAFSRWVPTGNEADLEASDFIEYFAYDDDTAVIAGYFEGFRDGAKLRRALAAANSQGKPVVMIKVGRQEAASRMASTHTAHLTGSDAVINGLFRQYGVIRVDDVDELIETAALHAKMAPVPKGPRVVLYGISGGAVALMAEQAEAHHVAVPVLSEETQRRLHEVLPAHLGVSNPVDNGNLYRTGTPEARRRVFELMCEDPSVDVLVCALTGLLPGITDDFAGDILDYMRKSETPVVVTWNTWAMDSPAYTAIVESGVPIFRSFRNCFRALAGYFEHQRRAEITRSRPPYLAPEGRSAASSTIRTLDPAEAAALLSRHGIAVPQERLASSTAEAAAAAEELGFPVVLKAPLPDFPHKSDVGLVRTGIHSADEAVVAFEILQARARELAPALDTPPILVQQQVGAGVEMIVGITRDPTVGEAILVGLGGVLTEVLHDVSVRPLPITVADAEEMLHELRGYRLLEGVRGAPRADVEALIQTVLAVAELAGDPASRVVELDLNPVIVGSQGAVAVDSLIVVDA